MKGMFCHAVSFSGDVSQWDTGQVADMNGMFAGASTFNGDLSGWNTDSLDDMEDMFHRASSFHGDRVGLYVLKNDKHNSQGFFDRCCVVQ